MHKQLPRIGLLVLAFFLSSCGGGGAKSPVSAQRVVSIVATPPQSTPPTGADYLAALQLAQSVGVHGQYIAHTWKELESSPGVYDFSTITNTLQTDQTVGNFRILLGIRLLDTSNRALPADLQSTPFDSPQMQTRFQSMISALLKAVGSQITYLTIGDEVDVYLNSHPTEWSAYKTFFDTAAAFVRQQTPGIKVGVTFTFNGANTTTAQVQTLNTTSDLLILTYYPLNPDFTPRDPSVVGSDFSRMISIANGKTLVLQEAGYPASSALGSSEQAQAQFVSNVYSAWSQNAPQIPFVNFFQMGDFTQTQCDSLAAYYGLSGSVNFTAYVCSLGFRRLDGTPKAAWQPFAANAQTVSQ